jgi:hypothetical protein
MNLFDTNTYPRPSSPEHCLSCSKEAVAVTNSTARKAFRTMTGLRWPGSVNFPLTKDLHVLGLDTVQAPDQALLCVVCAVEYMQEFNARNAEMRKAEGC